MIEKKGILNLAAAAHFEYNVEGLDVKTALVSNCSFSGGKSSSYNV